MISVWICLMQCSREVKISADEDRTCPARFSHCYCQRRLAAHRCLTRMREMLLLRSQPPKASTRFPDGDIFFWARP
jgi:hypothetical protein